MNLRDSTGQNNQTSFVLRMAGLLNLRPGEGRLVALILLYTFCSYTANIFAYTAAYALFLNQFDAQRLPYIYIGESIFSTLVTLLYLRLSQRYSLTKLLFGQLAIILATLIGYRLGLIRLSGGWFIFSLPIWYGVLNNVMYLAFWNLLGRLFNIQQGKRLFSLLNAGQEVATVSVGLLVPLIVLWTGTTNLLLLAAVSIAGAWGVLLRIVQISPTMNVRENEEIENESATGDTTENTKPSTTRVTSLLADPYIRLIFAMFLLFGLGDYFVDNLFYAQVESRFVDQNQLASFLGTFTAIVGGINLFSQLFLSSRLLRRFGVRTIILLTPLILLSAVVPFVLVGSLAGTVPILFWLAVLMNLSRRVTDTFDNTASNLLYQPLPATLRTQTQTTIDGIFYPIVGGLTGILLLYLNNVLGFMSLQLAYVLLPIVAVWALISFTLGRLYAKRVQQALRQRIIHGNLAFQPDRAGLDSIRQHLADPHPGAVLYALGVLEATTGEELTQALPALLQHPSPYVRLDVLARLERLNISTALPAINQCLQIDGDPQVRALALQTLATLGGLSESDAIDHYLTASDPSLRQAAMIGLLRSGDLEGILAVGETLTKLVDSTVVDDRIFAAQVLGESRMTSLYRPVLKLLHDAEPSVQQAALSAAAKIQHPKLWSQVIAALGAAPTRSAAQQALVMGGEAALLALQQAFAQVGSNPQSERQMRGTLARICGRIRSPQSTHLLLSQLDFPDLQVRTQTLVALHHCGYRADAATRPLIEAAIQDELAHALWTLTNWVDLGELAAETLLRNTLAESLVEQQSRLLLWLSLLYDAAIIQRVRTALGLGLGLKRLATEEQRSYALETIDLLVDKSISKSILVLLDDLPPAQQIKQLGGDVALAALDLPLRLLEIITGDERWVTPWLKTVALYSVGSSLAEAQISPTVQQAVAALGDSVEPMVRETASWVMAKLDSSASSTQS